MLWAMKTSVFYWWPSELTTLAWQDAKIHCCAVHHLMLQHDNAARKLKMSQFLCGQHAHQTCPPLGMFEMLSFDSVFQFFPFVPIHSKCAQLSKRSGPWLQRLQSDQSRNSIGKTCVALCEANGGQTPPPPQHIGKNAQFKVAINWGQLKDHLCNNYAVWSASWYAIPLRI